MRIYGPAAQKRGSDRRARGIPKSNSREYHTWEAMHARCYNRKSRTYPQYGGRGISIHPRYHRDNPKGFENFFADLGHRPENTSIDRIDPRGHYEPGNLRWATADIQAWNRLSVVIYTCGGVKGTLNFWARKSGIPKTTFFRWVLEQRMSIEAALERAKTHQRKKFFPTVLHTHNGQLGTLSFWALEFGVPSPTFRIWIKDLGLTIDEGKVKAACPRRNSFHNQPCTCPESIIQKSGICRYKKRPSRSDREKHQRRREAEPRHLAAA